MLGALHGALKNPPQTFLCVKEDEQAFDIITFYLVYLV